MEDPELPEARGTNCLGLARCDCDPIGDLVVLVDADPDPEICEDEPLVDIGLARWEIEFLGLGPGETDGVVEVLDCRDRGLPSGATPLSWAAEKREVVEKRGMS